MIAVLIIMTTISASMRLAPFLFSRWLEKWGFMEKLAATLPLCILILLAVHMLEGSSFIHYPFGLPEIGGILGVVAVQVFFRNILLSMAIGVCANQLILYLV